MSGSMRDFQILQKLGEGSFSIVYKVIFVFEINRLDEIKISKNTHLRKLNFLNLRRRRDKMP